MVAVGLAALLKFPVEPVAVVQTAPFVTLTDGRNISYSLRGDPAATYTVLYLHRCASAIHAGLLLSTSQIVAAGKQRVSSCHPTKAGPLAAVSSLCGLQHAI